MRRMEGSSETVIGRGDVWMTGLWQPHGTQVVKAPCKRLVLFIQPEFLSGQYFPECPELNLLSPFLAPFQKRPYVDPGRKAHFLSLAKRMTAELFRHGHSGKVSIIKTQSDPPVNITEFLREGLIVEREYGHIWARKPHDVYRRQLARQHVVLLQILLDLMDGWTAPKESSRDIDTTHARTITPALKEAFVSHKAITVNRAAQLCGMGRRPFQLAFREIMGESFARFSLKCRLNRAATDLRTTSTPIKGIAFDWGFNDVSHFHRTFQSHYGITPRQYRKLDKI